MAVLVGVSAYAAAYASIPVLLVLPHELGHALAALALGASRADVVVGREPRRVFQVGRLSVRIRPLNAPRWIWYGTVDAELENASRASVAAAAAAGPLVTLALVLAYGFAGAATHGFWRVAFWFLAIAGAWTFVVTALPIHYGRFFGPYAGRVSDGQRIRAVLRS